MRRRATNDNPQFRSTLTTKQLNVISIQHMEHAHTLRRTRTHRHFLPLRRLDVLHRVHAANQLHAMPPVLAAVLLPRRLKHQLSHRALSLHRDRNRLHVGCERGLPARRVQVHAQTRRERVRVNLLADLAYTNLHVGRGLDEGKRPRLRLPGRERERGAPRRTDLVHCDDARRGVIGEAEGKERGVAGLDEDELLAVRGRRAHVEERQFLLLLRTH